MPLEFSGAATPLSDSDIVEVAQQLGVEPALIAAVADVESSGAGFLPDGRPKILFEAHVFGRLTGHRYDRTNPNISAPAWDRSLYGATGAHQHDRLQQAIEIDRGHALQSASWGRFQIMGFNYAACGFADIESFVASMATGEQAHLSAFAKFCKHEGLLAKLIAHEWADFARGYNGAGYAANQYDTKLAAAYQENAGRDWVSSVAKATATPPQVGPSASPPTPSMAACLDKRTAVMLIQSVLRSAGHDPGALDGIWGRHTEDALSDLVEGKR